MQTFLRAQVRTNLFIPLVVVAMAGLVVSACISGDDEAATPATGSAELELTESDNDGTFEVAVDEVIMITLPANPSTGYEWAVAGVNSGIVRYEGSNFSRPETDAVGSDGEDILTFRAVRDGSSTIELKYWRSWEGDSSISDTFTVTVNVS